MGTIKVPAAYMRGGVRRAVFFDSRDLPADAVRRERLLLRALGSPDPCARHLDGMGGAANEPQVVVVAPSTQPGCDVEYLCGRLGAERAGIDWSHSSGDLAAAVGPYALQRGMVAPREGSTVVRIWQAGVRRLLHAHVGVRAGEVIEEGAFVEDGIPFPAAEVRLDFVGFGDGRLLPTGRVQDVLEIPGMGPLAATLLDTASSSVFVRAADIGLTGREKADAFRRQPEMAERLRAIRIEAAVAAGMARGRAERPGTRLPRLVWVAQPAPYRTPAGQDVSRQRIDVLARVLGDAPTAHDFGTGCAIASSVAAALPGSVVSQVARTLPGVAARIGHAAGVQAAEASLCQQAGRWEVERVTVSRGARCLMSGWVHVPAGAMRPA